MTELFHKRIEVLIDNHRYTEHQIRFSASLSLTPEPDACTVEVFNPSAEDRSALESAAVNAQVVIYAGYGRDTRLPTIFRGRLRRVTTDRFGPDVAVKVEAGSAWRAREYGRQVNRTYRAGATVGSVISDLLRELEITEGNLSGQLRTLQLENVGSQFRAPFSVSGPAWASLVNLLESSGLTVTTQGDDLLALGIRDTLAQTAIVLGEETGLIGTPSLDKKGVLTCQALMVPDLVPGRKVKVQSETVTGDFKITKCDYSGSVYGDDFGVSLTGRKLTRGRG